ncbi:YHS domain-containing (seleno)protein [Flavobacterium sp. GT3R68]|uniref:YHS domain-containing (seleno)protein n=1 Tax=Flavobacterium sp. GT3R68 TaxID=2594437 RepID=UPI000F86AC1B|nr:YHS domain-containing (seleno)protein [Flavobacterium sp. GT3R68]RTY88525.1 YHS domain protein [Flavobacterium sp. GSN2]TRW92625.1 YHS domain protein [Flavobacterium sp. GT3R68]
MKKLIFLLIAFLSIMASAQNGNKRITHFNLDKKVAIQGYDPIAYFKQGKAVKGKKDFSAAYEGVVYYFSAAANKELFLKSPTSYEPQYGGWCAYAMGDSGEKVEINPETFKIVDGKLYLFYNAFFNNTMKTWNKNEVVLKKKADASWKKISN